MVVARAFAAPAGATKHTGGMLRSPQSTAGRSRPQPFATSGGCASRRTVPGREFRDPARTRSRHLPRITVVAVGIGFPSGRIRHLSSAPGLPAGTGQAFCSTQIEGRLAQLRASDSVQVRSPRGIQLWAVSCGPAWQRVRGIDHLMSRRSATYNKPGGTETAMRNNLQTGMSPRQRLEGAQFDQASPVGSVSSRRFRRPKSRSLAAVHHFVDRDSVDASECFTLLGSGKTGSTLDCADSAGLHSEHAGKSWLKKPEESSPIDQIALATGNIDQGLHGHRETKRQGDTMKLVDLGNGEVLLPSVQRGDADMRDAGEVGDRNSAAVRVPRARGGQETSAESANDAPAHRPPCISIQFLSGHHAVPPVTFNPTRTVSEKSICDLDVPVRDHEIRELTGQTKKGGELARLDRRN